MPFALYQRSYRCLDFGEGFEPDPNIRQCKLCISKLFSYGLGFYYCNFTCKDHQKKPSELALHTLPTPIINQQIIDADVLYCRI